MFKNRPPIYDISGNPSYIEINFDHYLQLTSLEFRGKAKKKKMLSIDISHSVSKFGGKFMEANG